MMFTLEMSVDCEEDRRKRERVNKSEARREQWRKSQWEAGGGKITKTRLVIFEPL